MDAIEGELLLLHVVPDLSSRWLDHLAITFINQSRLESGYEDLCAEGQRPFSTWPLYQAHERCRTLVVVGDTADAIADATIDVAQVEAADVIIMRAPKCRWWRPVLAGSGRIPSSAEHPCRWSFGLASSRCLPGDVGKVCGIRMSTTHLGKVPGETGEERDGSGHPS